MALAALAAGADGLLIEVHPDPDKALSDAAPGRLTSPGFEQLLAKLACLAEPGGFSEVWTVRSGLNSACASHWP